MAYSLEIALNGSDIRPYALVNGFEIEANINDRVDTCSLQVYDESGTLTISPWDELTIDGYTGTMGSFPLDFPIELVAFDRRVFGGYIARQDTNEAGISNKKIFSLDATDYTVLLDKAYITKIYESKTDQQIIQDAFTGSLPEIDTSTYVETDNNTIERLVFNRVTLRDLMDRISKLSGYDWYVDYNKHLHYFASTTNTAPFDLNDSPGAGEHNYRLSSYEKGTIGDVTNRVTVVGGTYLSSDTDFLLPNNGTTTELNVPYPLEPPAGQTKVLVYKNTNTDASPVWSSLTVGIDYKDDLTSYDCLWNKSEKILKFGTAPSNLNKSIKIKGKYAAPVLVTARSDASYNQYGRWLDGKVVDKSLENRDDAFLKGKATLASYAFVPERGNVTVWDDGLVPGQRIKFTNSLLGISDYYLTRRVVTRWLAPNTYQYDVDFGEWNPDLIDMLLTLKRRTEETTYREDEVLNQLFEIPDEEATIADQTPTATGTGLNYYVSPATSGDPIVAGYWTVSA